MADTLVGNIRISARPDQLDAEQVSEAIRGRFWELLRQRIAEMIAGHRQTLEQSSDDREFARAQGAIAALRRTLDLPDLIRKEAVARASKR